MTVEGDRSYSRIEATHVKVRQNGRIGSVRRSLPKSYLKTTA